MTLRELLTWLTTPLEQTRDRGREEVKDQGDRISELVRAIFRP